MDKIETTYKNCLKYKLSKRIGIYYNRRGGDTLIVEETTVTGKWENVTKLNVTNKTI